MLLGITEIVAILFVSIWLKENIAPAKAKTATPVNECATFNPQNVSSGSVSTDMIGGADKLKLYKDLLDSGAITQEEFDIKKKQILGM